MVASDVTAWIVAITKFAKPTLPPIRQSVGVWALEFAELMLSHGVPKIVLSTSLDIENPAYKGRLASLEAQGVVRTGADVGDLQDALLKLHGKGCLMTYWVGHGISAPNRQLLCADSTSMADLRTITIESLLRRLRSGGLPTPSDGLLRVLRPSCREHRRYVQRRREPRDSDEPVLLSRSLGGRDCYRNLRAGRLFEHRPEDA